MFVEAYKKSVFTIWISLKLNLQINGKNHYNKQ